MDSLAQLRTNNENIDGTNLARSTGRHWPQDWFLAGVFAAPYFVFRDADVELTLASPKGGQPPIDPKSDLPESDTRHGAV